MNSLAAKEVTYEYRNAVQTVRAVNGVSCEFRQGLVYAVVGASGSGKTTFLSLLAGLDVPVGGSIDFDGVSFKYSAGAEKYALRDIDLHIAPGQTVGILGGTGSSKSTLVQLIPRLYDVSEGCVKVGGRDVREYDLEALRGGKG